MLDGYHRHPSTSAGLALFPVLVMGLSSSSSSSSASPLLPAKPVLIIGGSFAGLCVARHLERHHRALGLSLTLVEPKDYFEYTPSILRALVTSGMNEAEGPESLDLLVPLDKAVARTTRIVQGWFVGIKDGDKAIVRRAGLDGDDKEQEVVELPFAYLVVCTGSSYAAPIKPIIGSGTDHHGATELTLGDRVRSLRASSLRVKAAASVLIVGGGTVGVELAAEITHYYPSKQVTLLTRSSVLLPSMPRAAQHAASKWLSSRRNVTIILNDELLPSDAAGGGGGIASTSSTSDEDTAAPPSAPKTYRTRRGREVNASLVFCCVGPRPATSAYLSSTPGWRQANTQGGVSSSTNSTDGHVSNSGPPAAVGGRAGLALLAPTLQVMTADSGVGERPVVLAAGDVASIGGDVTAMAAELQGEAAAQTIIQLASSSLSLSSTSRSTALPPYPHCLVGCDTEPLVYDISLGPRQGILVFDSLVIHGFLGGGLAALAKVVIEKTKLLEVKQCRPAMWMWESVAHPMTFCLHRIGRFFTTREKRE